MQYQELRSKLFELEHNDMLWSVECATTYTEIKLVCVAEETYWLEKSKID